MEKHTLNDILYCLQGDRTLFQYSKDEYALQLLTDYIGEGLSIAELKRSPFAQLTNKAIVKQALALAGDGVVTPAHISSVLWQQQNRLNFVLKLACWGASKKDNRSYRQISRAGYNLVLQLNFANDHQEQYQKLIKPAYAGEFSSLAHPVSQDLKVETLAWARIDLDFDSNQALIEEVQSDWVRQVKQPWLERIHEKLPEYREAVLKPYAKIWDQAILAATIKLIRHDLGIDRIFYHSFETGNIMKNIPKWSKPPRSLYTDLPRQFAFTRTHDTPEFLKSYRQTKLAYRSLGDDMYWFTLPTTGQ